MRQFKSQLGVLLLCAHVLSCSGQSSDGDPSKLKDLANSRDALPDHPNIRPKDTTFQPSATPTPPPNRPPPSFAPSPEPSPIQVDIPKNEPGKPQVSADFNKFCAGAQTAKIFATSAGLKSLLSEICDVDTVKPFLAATLLRNVYPGSGNMRHTVLRALNSDSTTQVPSIRFAYALKLPITAEDYFDFVLPKSLTVEGVKDIVQGAGGIATINEMQRFTKDGSTHVRGVLVQQMLQKEFDGRPQILQSESRYDHHRVEDGFSYFTTSTIVRPYSTVTTRDTLSMIVRLGNDSYLISIVDTSMSSREAGSVWDQVLTRWNLEDSNAHYKRIIDDSKL